MQHFEKLEVLSYIILFDQDNCMSLIGQILLSHFKEQSWERFISVKGIIFLNLAAELELMVR